MLMLQLRIGGQSGDEDGGGAAVAVGIIRQFAAYLVVEDAVIGILRGFARGKGLGGERAFFQCGEDMLRQLHDIAFQGAEI